LCGSYGGLLSESLGTMKSMPDGEDYTVRPIGFVRSPLRDRRDAPRQAHEGAPEAVLELDEEVAPALHRVRPWQDLILLTWLHVADRTVLQTHPRDDASAPLTGVFATRSSDRPNPIGLHRVTVIVIESPTRPRVSALEAIDGTPILDLKAVMAESRDA
jgi:tRNA-Thr(GGU) m(6)t(6)A37 methyltransferase TsaA